MAEENKKLDCYWFIFENKIKATCVDCHKKGGDEWFWKGSELGYGDYELKCSVCERIINKKVK